MKRVLGILLVLTIIISAFSGCDFSVSTSGSKKLSTKDTADVKAGTWTIMIYMCGADLESDQGSATTDLDEMTSADLPDNVNLLVETGGCKEWQNDVVDKTKLQRYKVEDGDIVLKDEQKLASMGKTSTLTSFLQWGADNYPAEKYMTVFWNHGGGSESGVCNDELYDDDYLSIKELTQGIKNSDTDFEIIGFDTCLMATMENAINISPYGNYMVASEEEETGDGWNYTAWLNYLAKDTTMSGAKLGTKICKSYYEDCKKTDEEDIATESVIDLSKMEEVKECFSAFASKMDDETFDLNSFNNLEKHALKSEKYGGSTKAEGYSNMIDLTDLANNCKSIIPDESTDLIDAVADCVVYSKNGVSRSKAKGLSVFYPIDVTTEDLDTYATCTDITEYLDYISALYSDWDYTPKSNTRSVSKKDVNVKFKTFVNDDGYFTLNINSGLDAVQSVMFDLYCKEDGKYVKLGLDDDIDANWDTGIFTDNFRGKWLTMGDYYVAPELIDEEDDYNIYSVPIKLNGERTNLRIKLDLDTEEYSIIGVYDGVDDNGISSRISAMPKNNDKITFLFYTYDDDDNEQVTEGGTITYSDNTTLEEQDLFNGTYYYSYTITDLFGKEYYSDLTEIKYKDGETQFID